MHVSSGLVRQTNTTRKAETMSERRQDDRTTVGRLRA